MKGPSGAPLDHPVRRWRDVGVWHNACAPSSCKQPDLTGLTWPHPTRVGASRLVARTCDNARVLSDAGYRLQTYARRHAPAIRLKAGTLYALEHLPLGIECRAAARIAISDNGARTPVYPLPARSGWHRGWIVLDLIGIAFSGVMILFVLYRAVMLDRSQPWFEAAPEPAPVPEAAPTLPARPPPRLRGNSR